MEQNDVTMFQQSLMACGDPIEIARKVKLAFKKMPGEMALACFAKVMTADLPHTIKVAVWDAVRYSHIWWGVDEVLRGPVMENSVVQQAFADDLADGEWYEESGYPNQAGRWRDSQDRQCIWVDHPTARKGKCFNSWVNVLNDARHALRE